MFLHGYYQNQFQGQFDSDMAMSILGYGILSAVTVLFFIQYAKLQTKYDDLSEDYYTHKEVLRQALLARVELDIMDGTEYRNTVIRDNFIKDYLKREVENVESRLEKKFPHWSKNDINFVVTDYYGFTKDQLKLEEEIYPNFPPSNKPS